MPYLGDKEEEGCMVSGGQVEGKRKRALYARRDLGQTYFLEATLRILHTPLPRHHPDARGRSS